MTSITSRPFNGQLGSAEQNSNIVLAAGKGFIVQRGSGEVGLYCMNNSNTLGVYDASFGNAAKIRFKGMMDLNIGEIENIFARTRAINLGQF